MKDYKVNQSWIFSLPIAHRGYHEKNCPENSALAFLTAIEKGYAVETDVHMTIDKKLVCVHDDNLKRICGVDKDVRQMTYAEVKNLRLFNTEQKILTFDEFLELIDGKTPIMIEIKSQLYDGIEPIIINSLKNYKGKFAIESFNPLIIKRLKKIAPFYNYGVVATKENFKGVNKFYKFIINNFIYRHFLKLDFINVRIDDLEKSAKKLKKHKIITWTIKNQRQLKIAEKYALNITFEKQVGSLGKFELKK